MMDFCILGSGIAGSTIANLLSKKYSVEVFDKARGPGGRASNRRFEKNLSFDHGVQYISPKSKDFKKFIEKLYKKNILNIWDGNHLDFTFKNKLNSKKYIGKKTNNDICKYQLKNIKQNYYSHIKKILYKKNYWEITLKDNKVSRYKGVIISCPFPQLKKLAKKYLPKKILNLDVKMNPQFTLMLVLKNQKKIPISSIKFDDGDLLWAANENSKKRFKSNLNLWTIQSSTNLAKNFINTYRENHKVKKKIEKIFMKKIGIKKTEIIYSRVHGWKYSFNSNATSIKNYWNKKCRLGVCGDWFLGPKVEHAWLSATSLFKSIK